MEKNQDFTVPTLGAANIPSPIELSNVRGDSIANYVGDDEGVLNKIRIFNASDSVSVEGNQLELAGP
ncbi:MAG: ATP-dependent 6-phosphofructokinase, partial [Spirochaetales bacterium]|nr:ATP-dependent 6-phosphofructokinase [Spirochaetales bacterium]